MAIKRKFRIEEHAEAFCLGLILNDTLLFEKFFQKKDLSLEPTVPQKLMILDESQNTLLCTSRNVAKSVSLIGRIVKDLVTYQPATGTRNDEILVFTPAESHLTPLVGRIFDMLTANPLFRPLIKTWNRTTDKPLIATYSGLSVHFRIEGQSGTDINMVGLHPYKIYGDECAFGNHVCHRSRMAGALPNCRVIYAGVPNGVRNTPFYQLDKTHDGDGWSRHKFSMLTANPLFISSAKYKKKIVKMFGGEHSPDYITQVLGEWGDEAMSSFPPGSVSFDTFLYGKRAFPYYDLRITGSDVGNASREHRIPSIIRVPSVQCIRAVIGWDYGYSPDPATFFCVIQTEEGGAWKSYARISLYSTPLHQQIEILRHLISNVFSGRVVCVSTDNQIGHQEMMRPETQHIFRDIAKLSNPGGTIEYDLVDGIIVDDSNKDRPEIALHRADGKIIKEWRKYWLTEMLRRYMTNAILRREDDVSLELGYDAELESELLSTVERRTEKHTVYEVPKDARKTPLDQITDALRYAVDGILLVESSKRKAQSVDMSGLLAVMGWAKTGTVGWKGPWDTKGR
jgi:hypothetical protein